MKQNKHMIEAQEVSRIIKKELDYVSKSDNIAINKIIINYLFTYACYYCNTSIIEEMIQRGADINLTNKNKDNALILASNNNNLEVCKLLLENNANVNVKNNLNYGPLDYAIYNNNEDLIDLLLLYGATPRTQYQEDINKYLVSKQKSIRESIQSSMKSIEHAIFYTNNMINIIDEYLFIKN